MGWNLWNFIWVEKSWPYRLGFAYFHKYYMAIGVNKSHLLVWKRAHCFVAACEKRRGMMLGWRRWGFSFRNVGVSLENVHPVDRHLYSAPAPLHCTHSHCGRGSYLFTLASSGRSICIPVSAALQIPSDGSFNRSQPFQTLEMESCAYRIISSSCYVSPADLSHCYQALICNLNPQRCIF